MPLTKDILFLLKKADIKVPKDTPDEKLKMIQAGIELYELDNNDVIEILKPETSILAAQRILTTNRKKDEIKHITTYNKPLSLDIDYERD